MVAWYLTKRRRMRLPDICLVLEQYTWLQRFLFDLAGFGKGINSVQAKGPGRRFLGEGWEFHQEPSISIALCHRCTAAATSLLRHFHWFHQLHRSTNTTSLVHQHHSYATSIDSSASLFNHRHLHWFISFIFLHLLHHRLHCSGCSSSTSLLHRNLHWFTCSSHQLTLPHPSIAYCHLIA